MFKTVPKNRSAAVIANLTSAKSFTLDNCFSGATVDDMDWLRRYLTRMEPKVRLDKETGKVDMRLHSNERYEGMVA